MSVDPVFQLCTYRKKKAPESYNIFRIKISDRLDRIRVFISSSHESNTKKEQSLEIKIENEVR